MILVGMHTAFLEGRGGGAHVKLGSLTFTGSCDKMRNLAEHDLVHTRAKVCS